MSDNNVVDPYERLKQLGHELEDIELPEWFEKVHRHGDLIFVSGMTSKKKGVPVAEGRIGAEVTLEQGYASAAQAMVNLLSSVHHGAGDLREWRPVKITIYGAAAPDFVPLGEVANGASLLLVDVFGPEYGQHARTTVSMPNPAGGAAVEIDGIFERR